MSAPYLWATIAAVALLAFALKAVGPALFGGRPLPPRTRAVVALTAPALLAGFIVVDLAGRHWSAVDATVIGGVAVALGLRLCRVPLPVLLVGAAAATALLRLI